MQSLAKAQLRKAAFDAVIASSCNFDSSWNSFVAGEPLHPHGTLHQLHSERGGGDCGGTLDYEYLWASCIPVEHPCRQVADGTSPAANNRARICPHLKFRA